MKKTIEVVAAIIANKNNEILFAQRAHDQSQIAGQWEFPGGKIDEGENPTEALTREIKEELELMIEVENYFSSVLYEYPKSTIHLHAYLCRNPSGMGTAIEHQQIVWLKKEKAQNLNFAPADIPIFQKLLITNWP